MADIEFLTRKVGSVRAAAREASEAARRAHDQAARLADERRAAEQELFDLIEEKVRASASQDA